MKEILCFHPWTCSATGPSVPCQYIWPQAHSLYVFNHPWTTLFWSRCTWNWWFKMQHFTSINLRASDLAIDWLQTNMTVNTCEIPQSKSTRAIHLKNWKKSVSVLFSETVSCFLTTTTSTSTNSASSMKSHDICIAAAQSSNTMLLTRYNNIMYYIS